MLLHQVHQVDPLTQGNIITITTTSNHIRRPLDHLLAHFRPQGDLLLEDMLRPRDLLQADMRLLLGHLQLVDMRLLPDHLKSPLEYQVLGDHRPYRRVPMVRGRQVASRLHVSAYTKATESFQ